MIPLAMIVLDELRDCVPEVPLTDWNDAIETFFLDRPDESLGVGVRVWCALGISATRMRASRSRRRTSWLHFRSRSQINTCGTLTTSASAIVSVRTICCMNSASGCGVDPRICTRRDARSMMKTV